MVLQAKLCQVFRGIPFSSRKSPLPQRLILMPDARRVARTINCTYMKQNDWRLAGCLRKENIASPAACIKPLEHAERSRSQDVVCIQHLKDMHAHLSMKTFKENFKAHPLPATLLVTSVRTRHFPVYNLQHDL